MEKIRLTGGEPLIRADLPDLIRALKQEVGLPDVALTTNGWLLARLAPALKQRGSTALTYQWIRLMLRWPDA